MVTPQDFLNLRRPHSFAFDDEEETVKFGFVGDPHFSSVAPRSRVDDYPQAILNKLSQVSDIAHENGWAFAVVAGDIFHTRRTSLEYLARVIAGFQAFHCPVFTLIGNHDIKFDRLDTLCDSPLWVMIRAGCLKWFSTIKVHSKNFTLHLVGADYQPVPEIPSLSDPPLHPIYTHNVLVAHAFWGKAWGDDQFVDPDEVVSKGYNAILLGHDHTPYPPIDYHGVLVVRPGALSRGTKAEVERARDVFVAEISVTGGDLTADYIVVDVTPSDQIFSEEKIDREDIDKKVSEFVKQLLTKAGTKGENVKQMLHNLAKDTPEVLACAEKYLQQAGIIN